MPPRASQGQNSFSVAQDAHQVICPLKNQDGTSCRKRCLGEKRYRSMQEHIRRAHPDHYIPKLPATEESFQLMINTPPSARPAPHQHASSAAGPSSERGAPRDHRGMLGLGADTRSVGYGSPAPSRQMEDQYTATAAVALAELQSQRPYGSDWGESDADAMSEHDPPRPGTNHSYDLPPLKSQLPSESFHAFPHSGGHRPRELLPSVLARSPPGRSSTLPPIQPARPRKKSLTQSARRPRHERTRSKEFGTIGGGGGGGGGHARRMSLEGRKASSAEPSTAMLNSYRNKRWEDLIEAATSATEADSDRDLTPIPQSPPQIKRASLPPYSTHVPPSSGHHDAYKASPLQRALTPPPADPDDPDDLSPPHPLHRPLHRSPGPDRLRPPSTSLDRSHPPPAALHAPAEPVPSVESSLDSAHSAATAAGAGFHMRPSGLSTADSDASPPFLRGSRGVGGVVEMTCANCGRAVAVEQGYACDGCIGGFCGDCVYVLSSERPGSGGGGGGGGAGVGVGSARPCPRCRMDGVRYKAIQLDIRR